MRTEKEFKQAIWGFCMGLSLATLIFIICFMIMGVMPYSGQNNMAKDINWIATRDGEPVGIFTSRRSAVSWIKKLLKQTLKDLDKQDRTDEFDYPIEISKYEIKQVENRESFLGL